MDRNDSQHTALLVSLAGALVAALESEDAEAAFVEQTRQFVDHIGDTLTLPISEVINLNHLEQDERRELLHSSLDSLGIARDGIDWQAHPEQALAFQTKVWEHLYQRFLQAHQLVTSHIELLGAPAREFARPLHTPTGSWQLLYVADGECRVAFHGRSLTLGDGGPAVLMVPPESTLSVARAANGSACSLFSSAFFAPEHWQPLLQRGLAGDDTLVIDNPRIAGYITESFGRIIDIAHASTHHSRALHINLLEQILLLCDEQRPRREQPALDRRVAAARDYLLAHYREKTTVEQVAAAANAAPSTLNTLFKNQMGENLMRWRDQLRMQRARELLQGSDKPIKVIAAEVGYDDPMFFSRRFKQITGWSPTQVRASGS